MITFDEIKSIFDNFKKEGKTDEELISMLYFMFKDDKINLEEFENCMGVLGYGLDDSFKNLPVEKQKDPNIFFGIDKWQFKVLVFTTLE